MRQTKVLVTLSAYLLNVLALFVNLQLIKSRDLARIFKALHLMVTLPLELR